MTLIASIPPRIAHGHYSTLGIDWHGGLGEDYLALARSKLATTKQRYPSGRLKLPGKARPSSAPTRLRKMAEWGAEMETQGLYHLDRAAELTGCTAWSLEYWRETGKLQAEQVMCPVLGKPVFLFRLDEIRRWLKERQK